MERIKESSLVGYPNVLPYKTHKEITKQMELDVCKINIENIQGTGFFCKIPFPDINNMLPVFITNNHVIDKKILNEKNKKIEIDIKAETEIKKIDISNRMTYTNEDYDITIIELKEKDNIKNFLILDDIIINDIINNINKTKEYKNRTLYIIQYPENELSVSYGILEQIYEDKKYNFLHRCSTKLGSSGSPILGINNKVIGIHKEGFKKQVEFNNNLGLFLNYPIKEFLQLNYNNINIKKDDDKYLKLEKEILIKKKIKSKFNIIKSIDIIQTIFIFLNEKIKLKTIKYNKELQNKIDININHYKFFSGRYIEYETNIKGKEYDGETDNLIFEGEYLNGERSGKGKEYNKYNGKLIFEGDYINGVRNGKGKEYNVFRSKSKYSNWIEEEYNRDIDILLYEGEYLDGERSGIGKEYNDRGDLIFEGEYLNGLKNGKGKEYNIYGKLIFEGEYLNGERNRKGKEYNEKDGKLLFEGEYLNGERNGKGKEYNKECKLIFEGDYLNGNILSYSLYNEKGDIYFNYKKVKGILKKYDKLFGNLQFEYKYNNKERYVKGKEYNPQGEIIFNGVYLNGKKWKGFGREYNYKGEITFEGEYLNGKKWNGIGKVYNKYGELIYEGELLKGQISNRNKYHGFNNKYILSQYNKASNDINSAIIKKEYGSECLNGREKVKKYNKNGELIFYGEYLYCQKLKGKEYLDGNLIFEGEYLFNKKWEGKGYDKYGNLLFTLNKGNGKVKEYIEYNELHYVGEILNGRKNRKGKEYNDYGELIFEGEYLKGRKNGKGKEYNNYNDLILEGEYLNGQRWNGKGKEYNNSNDLIFEGEYLNGKKKGIWKEYILNDNLFSKSELNNCIMDIDIESTFDKILQFEGEYLNGEKNGKGKEFRNGKIIFEGEYLNGKKMEKEKNIMRMAI